MKKKVTKGIPTTIFNADECQCLLDILDRLLADNWTRRSGKTLAMFAKTKEDMQAYKKLERAGRFYVPERLQKELDSLKAKGVKPMDFLDDLLKKWWVHPPGYWKNRTKRLQGWWAVAVDGEIIAFFANCADAHRFRMNMINRELNP